MKKTKEQIELAEKLLLNLEDYITLAKIQKKLKVEDVDQQIENLTDFICKNAENL